MARRENFGIRKQTRPVTLARAQAQQMTEDQLGECVRDACKKLGWHFLWLRKTYNSSDGILDLMLIHVNPRCPMPGYGRAIFNDGRLHSTETPPTILHRELKGHDRRGRLGKPTDAQIETVALINAAGGNAAVWEPADWFSGKILEELRVTLTASDKKQHE